MHMPARTSRGGTPRYLGPKARGPSGQPRPNQGNRGDQRRIEPRKPPTGFRDQVPPSGRHSPAGPHALQRITQCPRCSTDGLVSGGRACTTGTPDVGNQETATLARAAESRHGTRDRRAGPVPAPVRKADSQYTGYWCGRGEPTIANEATN